MPRPASRVEKRRITLEVSVEVYDQIVRLQDRLEADSMTEVIRRAIKTYEELLLRRAEGATKVLLL
jgi:predicted CopG family antitoxin